jgi:hypothetical protein
MPEKTFQVELNPVWQQKKLIEFCKEKGIHVTAYSPLGGQSRISKINAVLQSEVLKEIAEARGKSVAQVFSVFSQFIFGTVWFVFKSTSPFDKRSMRFGKKIEQVQIVKKFCEQFKSMQYRFHYTSIFFFLKRRQKLCPIHSLSRRCPVFRRKSDENQQQHNSAKAHPQPPTLPRGTHLAILATNKSYTRSSS